MNKISPEIRVGVVSVIIIVLFFWLFNFLKGQNILKSSDFYHIIYTNIAGLEESSPVEINGLRSGTVSNVQLINDGSGSINVTIRIEKGYNIPLNSIAEITTETLIAGMKIDLLLGDSDNFYTSGDTIKGYVAVSLIDKLDKNIDPIVQGSVQLIEKFDTLLEKINVLFSSDFSNNISSTSENLKEVSDDMKQLVSDNRENLTGLVGDLNLLGEMLENNRTQMDSTIKNVYAISTTISEADLDSTMSALNSSLKNSMKLIDKLNRGEGSAGKMFNDDSLYLNLTNSLESLNLLLKDLEENPDRYVHFSLFGKKNN